MIKQAILGALLALLVWTSAFAGGDPEAGHAKVFTCMGCHGEPGIRNAYPTYHVPRLGGQHAAYIVQALTDYQTKKRWHPTMRAQAATMTKQDMADIGAYFESMATPY